MRVQALKPNLGASVDEIKILPVNRQSIREQLRVKERSRHEDLIK
jgi:hypothetical protein